VCYLAESSQEKEPMLSIIVKWLLPFAAVGFLAGSLLRIRYVVLLMAFLLAACLYYFTQHYRGPNQGYDAFFYLIGIPFFLVSYAAGSAVGAWVKRATHDRALARALGIFLGALVFSGIVAGSAAYERATARREQYVLGAATTFTTEHPAVRAKVGDIKTAFVHSTTAGRKANQPYSRCTIHIVGTQGETTVTVTIEGTGSEPAFSIEGFDLDR
jgi:uncharacterized membrane protein YfcA